MKHCLTISVLLLLAICVWLASDKPDGISLATAADSLDAPGKKPSGPHASCRHDEALPPLSHEVTQQKVDVDWRRLKTGESFPFPLPDGDVTVILDRAWNAVDHEPSIRGYLMPPDRGALFIKRQGERVHGQLHISDRNRGYVITGPLGGSLDVREARLSDLLCVVPAQGGRSDVDGRMNYGLPRPTNELRRTRSAGGIRTTAVPVLQSRPGSTKVVYMDFDGEVVNDAAWSSSTINAAAARMNDSQIEQVWRRVCADFDHADVNITTVRADYDNAPFSSRTHVIITQTDTAAPGAGGVAYVNSFTGTDSRYCWVFIDDDAKACAEALSHEVGHTLGLLHDGRTSPAEEYYQGHGTGNTGWAPIMGVGYYRTLTQWSRGEYPNANRTENDLGIMAVKIPYLADDHGNLTSNATAVVGDLVRGRIDRTNDVDMFRLTLAPGAYTIILQPDGFSNLDGRLEILNNAGGSITSVNPVSETFATAGFSLAATQTVYLQVSGTGKSANGDDFGYTSYGSLGAYALSGFGNQQQPPSAPVALFVRAISGTQLEVSWQIVPGAINYDVYRNGSFLLSTTDSLFVDRGLAPGSNYFYQVKSGNTYGLSAFSSPALITTPAADMFVMDGNADFNGYVVSNPGMVIHAAVRGNRLYVSTWSPGDNGAGFGSDHHIMISDALLASATTAMPWGKTGLMAIPGNKPFLAGESTSTYAGWFNTSGATTLFKGPLNNLQLEGSIDLVSEFGAVPSTIYLAAIAFATTDGGGMNAQAPAGNGNNNLEPGEFLAVPTAAIRDSALDGVFDILSPQRSFTLRLDGVDASGRPQFSGMAIPGMTYVLQRAVNLADPMALWPGISTSTIPAGVFSLNMVDTQSPAASLFYRLHLVQP